MTLVLVEVPDEATVELLRQQPRGQVVGILAPPAAVPVSRPSIAGLVGSLSDETARQMRTETAQLRNEWEREF